MLRIRERRFASAEEALSAAIKSVAGTVALDESRVNFVIYQRLIAAVYAQYFLAALDVGVAHDDLAVEAARAQQRRVEDIGAVRRGDDDYALVYREAVLETGILRFS